MPIAPQVNLETYSSRVYTCSLTLPSITYGKLYNTVNDGGSAMTGSGSHSIQYVGTSAQVNIALDNTEFEPAADVVASPFNATYLQTDDNDLGGLGGFNTVIGTMEFTIRDTHVEHSVKGTQTYKPEIQTDWNFANNDINSITDLRPDNINSNTQYTTTLTLSDKYAGHLVYNNINVLQAITTGTKYLTKLSEDGNTLTAASYSGETVDVHTKSSGVWSYQQTLTGSAADPSPPEDHFGQGQAMSFDGTHLLIGAAGKQTNGDWTGGLYYFLKSGGTWSEMQFFTEPNWVGPGVGFGGEIAMDSTGTRAAVRGGTGLHIFYRSGGNWSTESLLTPTIGAYSMDMDGGGNTLIIGSISAADGDGEVQIFTRSGGTWSLQKTITGVIAGGLLGRSTGISSDGNTAIMGAPHSAGTVYIFGRSGTVWTLEATLVGTTPYQQFGYSCDLSADGNIAYIGNVGNGGTIYQRTGNTWAVSQSVDEIAMQHAGMSGDGRTVMGLGDNTNTVYAMEIRPSGIYTHTGTKLECNNALDNVSFESNEGYNSPFTITYDQQQNTDTVDQGSQVINVILGSLAIYARQGANHGATAGAYGAYAGGTIEDPDDVSGTKLYTLRLIHTGPNVTGYQGIPNSTWDGPSQTLTITGTRDTIEIDLAGFSVYVDTAGTVTVNGELDDDTLGQTVVSTDSYTITAS